jgi:hypothetical protein
MESIASNAIGLRTERPEFEFRNGQELTSSPARPDRVWKLLSLL